MKYFYWAAAIFILARSGVVNAQDSVNPKLLENIAITYMTAFNKGEFEEVVSLMHPEAIKNTSNLFLRTYEKAVSDGREAKFKNESNIDKSLLEIKQMEDIDVVAYLLRSNRISAKRYDPIAVEEMKHVVVNATGNKKINDYSYKVDFVMALPTGDNSFLQRGELLIKKVNGAWKVYR